MFNIQCPGDDPNDDSLEYSSGDMESDLDTEEPGVIQEGLPRQLQGELVSVLRSIHSSSSC
jgi:hypothetical protein